MARQRKRRSSGGNEKVNNDVTDWLMMKPCVGVVGLCPPLCTWAELNDGTYSLGDVIRFHIVIDELLAAHKAQ